MQLSGLQFDHIPPLNVPFRFYLTAPIFAIAFAVLLFVNPEQIWLSRWMPSNLAATHLLVLGVMAMVMFGSAFQLLPVLCGAAIPLNTKWVAVFHLVFSCAVVMLVLGFLGFHTFGLALLLFIFSFTILLGSVFKALLFVAAGKATRTPFILAFMCLAITVLLGVLLIANYLQLIPTWLTNNVFFNKYLTNWHASFGAVGWVFILIMTVSFQVIPMFHVSPSFSSKVQNSLPWMVFIGLCFMPIAYLLGIPGELIMAIFSVLMSIYAISALLTLAKRKRKLPDTTVYFWQLALICLLSCSALLSYRLVVFNTTVAAFDVFIGGLFFVGFVLSVIMGMLLKIVPFLITLHLQRLAMKYPMGMGLLPDFYQIISRAKGRMIFKMHILSLILFVLAFLMEPFIRIFALSFIVLWGSVLFAIVKAALVYQRIYRQIENAKIV